jgi:pilus assembly protein CpaE
VFSLKGGVGTTTIAVNMAVAVKQLAPSTRVGLIDLSLEEGADALLLDILPTSTIVDWARENHADATPYLLNQYFVQHRTGIGLLAAPPSPEQAETVRPDLVRDTLRLAPDAFDYIVVDTASTFSESSLIALEHAQSILLPVTPDMPTLKTAVNTLRILKAVNIGDDKISVVLNEIVPRAGLTRQQVEDSLGKKVHIIPHAGPMFIEAANHGMPLVTAEQQTPVTKALVDLAKTLCEPEEIEGSAHAKAKFGVLGRLRRA